MDYHDAQAALQRLWHEASSQISRVPGSAMVVRYIKSSHQNDPVRSVVELFLFIFFIRYLLSPKYSTVKKDFVKLSEDEIDELVEEWTPEPLVAPLAELEELELEKRPVIVGPTGPKVKLTNGRTVTNLASYSFYNFNANEGLKDKVIQTLRSYGVGPCGPPGFYGTQDVHIKTESDVARFLGTEACIIYANAFSTISSVIPSFAKRGDIIIADRAVNCSILKGLQISRSAIKWFEHNNMDDLERVLQRVNKEQAKKPLTRRFIVTEALFENVGDLVNLPKLIELKQKYKYRLILDETWSFGVLGATGRGVTEQQNVDPLQVDMIVGSLAGAFCAGGGFCAGSAEIVEHQRINSTAYVFSAALPAMMGTITCEAITMLQDSPEILLQLRENIEAMWGQIDPRSEWVTCTSAVDNPVMIVTFKDSAIEPKGLQREEQEKLLQDIVDECLSNGVLISRLKSMPMAIGSTAKDVSMSWQPKPALKISLTTGLSKKEVEKAGTTIRHAITKVMSRKK